jgi:HSP20 family protein
MLTRLFDFSDPFALFDEFERRLSRAVVDTPVPARRNGSGLSLKDGGDALTLTASLPGLKREDVELTIEGEALTLKASRKLEVPKGYRVLRRERADIGFTKRIELGVHIDAGGVRAELDNGVLTVTLPKAAEAKPRKITIGKEAAPAPVGQA